MKVRFGVFRALLDVLKQERDKADMDVGVYETTPLLDADGNAYHGPSEFKVGFATCGSVEVERAMKVADEIKKACETASLLNKLEITYDRKDLSMVDLFGDQELFDNYCNALRISLRDEYLLVTLLSFRMDEMNAEEVAE